MLLRIILTRRSDDPVRPGQGFSSHPHPRTFRAPLGYPSRLKILPHPQGVCHYRTTPLDQDSSGEWRSNQTARPLILPRRWREESCYRWSESFHWHVHSHLSLEYQIDASAGKNKIVAKVTAGVNDLLSELCVHPSLIYLIVFFLVLKSTGSAFTNFLRDEYTTLVEVDDRIFSTSVDLSNTFTQFDIPAPKDDKKLEFIIPKEEPGSIWDPKVPEAARKVTLETFAEDDSASVQASCLFHSTSIFFSLPPLLGCIFSSFTSRIDSRHNRQLYYLLAAPTARTNAVLEVEPLWSRLDSSCRGPFSFFSTRLLGPDNKVIYA